MHRAWMSVLAALLLLLQPPALLAQQGGLRERIRERLQERQPAAEPAAPARVLQPGDYRYGLNHGGLQRAYLVHVPRGYDPAQPMPVLLALHGGGGHMELQADDERYGLIGKSERAGFIAVFPNGYSVLPRGRLATWNAGGCCGAARDRQIDDVGFIRAVIADLARHLNIDAGRVYAAGMSNGGMMAHRLACEAADLLAGVAAVAGTDNTQSCTPARPIAVLQIHARDDDHVLFEGGAGPQAFRDVSKVTDFTSVPETMARWSRRNACGSTPLRILERPGAYCERYPGCRGGAAVQLCVTESGGHSWPGGGKQGASQALSANDVMWDFFSGR